MNNMSIVYVMHPNLSVTRELRHSNGVALSSTVIGRYVFMNQESRMVFVNLIGDDQPGTRRLLVTANRSHTPGPDYRDKNVDNLKRSWSVLVHKLKTNTTETINNGERVSKYRRIE